MGDRTKIEWTRSDDGTPGATWNPIVGCSRVSPGCDHCYAIGVVHRQMSEQHRGLTVVGDNGVDWNGQINVVEHLMDLPLRWQRPRRVFTNSLSDLFHPTLDELVIARIVAVMSLAERHTFQVLTKRPKAMAGCCSSEEFRAKVAIERRRIVDQSGPKRRRQLSEVPFVWPLPNVWWGVSIESNRYAWRADHLRDMPAAVRWVSAEPLLGPLDELDLTGIDWVVAGGESGPGARPMHPRWVRDLRDACLDRPAACEIPDVPLPHSVPVPGGGRACACEYPDPVAFHFKQWGSWVSQGSPAVTPVMIARVQRDPAKGYTVALDGTLENPPVFGHEAVYRMPKADAGRVLDGRTWDEYPR